MLAMRTLTIINQKGGVGKTTTVANLGAAMALRGHRICLLDLDPQAHLTLHFGLEPGQAETGMYELFMQQASIVDAAVEVTNNLHVVPSVIDLAAAEAELVSAVGREQILRRRLDQCPHRYDYILIDCPPSLGLLTLNALAAARDVFIPLQAHFLALQGLGKLLEVISLVHQRINARLHVAGVILCMYEKQTRLAGEVVADLEKFFAAARNTGSPWAEARIFSSAIRRNIKLAECPSYGKAIFDYDPHCNGASDYGALTEEFLAYLAATEAQTEGATSSKAGRTHAPPVSASAGCTDAVRPWPPPEPLNVSPEQSAAPSPPDQPEPSPQAQAGRETGPQAEPQDNEQGTGAPS